MIENILESAERRGFAVSVHPTGTALVKNFRETMLMFPNPDGSVGYEIREPLYPPNLKGTTFSEDELYERMEGLR